MGSWWTPGAAIYTHLVIYHINRHINIHRVAQRPSYRHTQARRPLWAGSAPWRLLARLLPAVRKMYSLQYHLGRVTTLKDLPLILLDGF